MTQTTRTTRTTRSRRASGFLVCRDLVDFLDAYLDRELPAAELAEFERHLAICPPCRAYLETYRTTIRLAGGAFSTGGSRAEPMPEELVEAILAARP